MDASGKTGWVRTREEVWVFKVSFSRSPEASPKCSDLEFQINNSPNLKTLVRLQTRTHTRAHAEGQTRENGVWLQKSGLFKMVSRVFKGVFEQQQLGRGKKSPHMQKSTPSQVLILKA